MKRLIALTAAVLFFAGALYLALFFRANVYACGRFYPRSSTELDLRGKAVSGGNYDQLQELMPQCTILWDVPFQSTRIPCDAKSIRVESLNKYDIPRLAYFPDLETLDAGLCDDPKIIYTLQEHYPQLQLRYTLPIEGSDYPSDTHTVHAKRLTHKDLKLLALLPELKNVIVDGGSPSYPAALARSRQELNVDYTVAVCGTDCSGMSETLSLTRTDVKAFAECLQYFPHLRSVNLSEPVGTAEDLLSLTACYPEIDFSWSKTCFGKTLTSDMTELDLSGSAVSIDEVRDVLAYFPGVQKADLSGCGIDSETLAAFREEMRDSCKIVWTVTITGIPTKTDATVFHAALYSIALIDKLSTDLKYCEDMVVMDAGHSKLSHIDWVRYMPNLQYLIVADNLLTDITPISTCKNLVYLELMVNPKLTDLTPVAECTTLEDLNVSLCPRADLTPLMQMTWLKNLWANSYDMDPNVARQLSSALPNTHVQAATGSYVQGGWRDVPGYHRMRDIMGQPHNTW